MKPRLLLLACTVLLPVTAGTLRATGGSGDYFITAVTHFGDLGGTWIVADPSLGNVHVVVETCGEVQTTRTGEMVFGGRGRDQSEPDTTFRVKVKFSNLSPGSVEWGIERGDGRPGTPLCGADSITTQPAGPLGLVCIGVLTPSGAVVCAPLATGF